MKYKSFVQGALVLGGIAFGGAALAATPSGQMLGNTCAGCHGTHGNTNGPATPSIAGIATEYFIETMKAYKSDARPATIMNRIAKGYSDEEIEAMAKFFAEQKFRPLKQDADAMQARLGEQLHKRSCEKCHEDGGKVSEDGGLLAGQPKMYLHWTLQDFLSGKREMPKKMKRRMDQVNQAKGDEGMAALVDFYASQGK